MSFQDQEQSSEEAAPIELFHITGSDEYFYTSSAVAYTHEGNRYRPQAISRSSPKINTQPDSSRISLVFPFDDPFVSKYLEATPPKRDKVTIYRVHTTDSEDQVVLFWQGTVSGVKFKEGSATVNLAPVMSSLQRQIPRSKFSWTCNHPLFSKGCGVSQADSNHYMKIVSVSSDGLTIVTEDRSSTATASTKISNDPTFFQGGIMDIPSNGSGQRMVIYAEYNEVLIDAVSVGQYTFHLMIPMGPALPGTQVTVTAGCDRAIQTCKSRFDNTKNYGGFPFVPTSNPFSTVSAQDDIKSANSRGNPIPE
jgi:uncharacterized phage protein (TIGR02218 family)